MERRKARHEFLEGLRIDYLIKFSLAYNGTYTVCKTVGTHYGDMLQIYYLYTSVLLLSTHIASLNIIMEGIIQLVRLFVHSLCEFNVPSLFGILARRAIFQVL